MNKLLPFGLLSILLIGCAPMAYEVNANTPSTNVYYYDSDYDYYDGMYGSYVGGVYYVYRENGTRYIAPSPRYSRSPRFSQRGWDGFRPGDRFTPPIYRPYNNNYYNGRYDDRPWSDRPHYNPNKPEVRPPVVTYPNSGVGRPDSNNGLLKPAAKPVRPIMHEQTPTPNNNVMPEWKDSEKNNRLNR